MNPPGFLSASLLVAGGGAIGAWLRFAAGRLIAPAPGGWPWATLTVNIAGSLAMGLLAGWLAQRGTAGEAWRLLLGVGVLGGFTTFSAFSLEVVLLAQRGAAASALGYALVSVIAGALALLAGLALMRIAA